jgi:hypothetical protein
LSYHFGITWADIETMPQYERDAYLATLETVRAEIRKINGGR